MNSIEKITKNITTNGIIGKIDELGRILIPKKYRKDKVIDGETKIAIYNIEKFVIIEILKNQSEDTNKKFDELGRVVIYKEIRKRLNWKEKDSIEMWNYDNYFILKKV